MNGALDLSNVPQSILDAIEANDEQDRFLRQLPLPLDDKEAFDELLRFAGINPDLGVYPSRIRHGLKVIAASVRWARLNHPGSNLARQVKLAKPMRCLKDYHEQPVLTAAGVVAILNSPRMRLQTHKAVPDISRDGRRDNDFEACAMLINGLLRHWWSMAIRGSDLLTPELLDKVATDPWEIAKTAVSYKRLITILEFVEHSTSAGPIALHLYEDVPIYSVKHADVISVRSFCEVMAVAVDHSWSAENIAAIIGAPWSIEDQERLIKLADQLRAHLF